MPSDNELKIHLVTYDGDLNKIWERPVSFSNGSEIQNIMYAGKGIVYITVSNPKNAKSPYTVVTIMDDKSTIQQTPISVDNKSINLLQLLRDQDTENIIAVGSYTEKNNPVPQGIVMSRLNQSNGELINQVTIPFDAPIKARITELNQKTPKMSGEKPLHYFRALNYLTGSNNEVYICGEFVYASIYIVNEIEQAYKYNSSDIVVIKCDADWNKVWAKHVNSSLREDRVDFNTNKQTGKNGAIKYYYTDKLNVSFLYNQKYKDKVMTGLNSHAPDLINMCEAFLTIDGQGKTSEIMIVAETFVTSRGLNLANKGIVIGDTYYYFYRKSDSKTAHQLYKIK